MVSVTENPDFLNPIYTYPKYHGTTRSRNLPSISQGNSSAKEGICVENPERQNSRLVLDSAVTHGDLLVAVPRSTGS